MFKSVTISLLVLLMILATIPTAAQDDVLAEGFISPRGIAYDSDGNLYVVQTGSGGNLEIEGMFGTIAVGGTGALTRIDADGRIEHLLMNLPSQGPADSARGPQDVIITDDAIWLLMGQAGGLPLSQAIVKFDRNTLRVISVTDIYAVEAAQNPDGDIVESNPTAFDMTADGVFYIADASCNCIMSWSEGNSVEVFTVWDVNDNPVPTGLALGNDNDLYVGFLSGFPFPEGGSRIERWSLDGELLETFDGLTTVVEVLVTDDGTVYAVEHGVFGDTGWGAGRVVRVDADGIETVANGLSRPWGLAITPTGDLAVVVDSVGTGSVIQIPLGN
jgi:hypothetical protein